jgi:two-component system OmpR family sensor kinase
VDLVALTGEVVADARVIDPARHITLSAPRAALVTGDASRMRQVVRNLIGNALQHTPPGTSIDVAVRPDATCRAPAVRLIVADEGPGIAHADQARVFERFYRSGAVRRHAGTGLGLAIVRAIVQAHGGTVSVDSAPGAGARFEVTVPAWSPDGPADHPKA